MQRRERRNALILNQAEKNQRKILENTHSDICNLILLNNYI